ncbi:hypothetical protein [Bacillus sp. Marseille-P3661]|uniref:hypothetical protein n=1 Tax=Bacillus sp. Marseille-P3661 TaxID=1936234 RepID=UPI000C849633|nr:hypothetical protein [Bacillus sp. Marseille-P3661]
MEELDTVYVIETSEDLYLVEDEIYEGSVLEGILELAVKFDSYEDAEVFLKDMKDVGIKGQIRTAKIYIEVIKE